MNVKPSYLMIKFVVNLSASYCTLTYTFALCFFFLVEPGNTPFDLGSCQSELTNFYKCQFGQVPLLPWFDERRNIDDIYVNLELENKNVLLGKNEHLVTIQTPQNTPATRVFVKGLVGSGKSTLMAELAYLWAQQKQDSPLAKFELAFLLSFREVERGVRLVDAIFQQLLSDDTKVSKEALENYIHSYSQKILVLLDGFDEYCAHAQNLTIPQGDIETMVTFNSLRNAYVIVTSRPHRQLGSC